MKASKGTLVVLKYLIALALIMIPVLGSSQPIAAQQTGLIDDETYVSDLTEEETTWSADWVFDEEQTVSQSDFESFLLEGDLGFFYVTYVDAGSADEEVLEAVTDGFISSLGERENIDSGDVGDGFYTLDLVEGEDLEFAVFSVITDVDGIPRVDAAVSTPESLGDHVDEIKSSFEFDGNEAFGDIDSVTDASVEVASQRDDDEDPTEDEDVTPTAEDEGPVEDDEDVTPTAEDEEPVDDEDTGDIDYSNATEYTFGLNDAVVEWQDPWTFEPELNYVEADYESVGFVDGTSFQSIIYLPTGTDLDTARDAFLEGFAGDDVQLQVIDRGSYANDASDVSYSLDLTDIDGTLFGLFTVYIDDGENVLAYATLSLADDLGESLDLAKETITINGEAVYNGVTGAGLQDLIDANSDSFTPTDTVQPDDDTDGSDGSEDPTPAPDDDVDPDAQDYLDTVREDFDDLNASIARFDELVGSGELSEDDIDELIGILEVWGAADYAFEALDVPAEYEDLHEVFLNYTIAIQDASLSFVIALSSESGSAEQEEAFTAYDASRAEAEEYRVELEDLLTDAGV